MRNSESATAKEKSLTYACNLAAEFKKNITMVKDAMEGLGRNRVQTRNDRTCAPRDPRMTLLEEAEQALALLTTKARQSNDTRALAVLIEAQTIVTNAVIHSTADRAE